MVRVVFQEQSVDSPESEEKSSTHGKEKSLTLPRQSESIMQGAAFEQPRTHPEPTPHEKVLEKISCL